MARAAREAGDVDAPTAPHRPDEDTSICLGCGLCCDGTLFSHLGVVDESDLGMPLSALGVTVIVEADPPVFALPCPAFDGYCCTIHDLHRPRACGWFECDVSTAVADGSMAWADARRVIDDTIVLRDRVRRGEAPETDLRRAVATHFRSG